jgi:hypothetical protein
LLLKLYVPVVNADVNATLATVWLAPMLIVPVAAPVNWAVSAAPGTASFGFQFPAVFQVNPPAVLVHSLITCAWAVPPLRARMTTAVSQPRPNLTESAGIRRARTHDVAIVGSGRAAGLSTRGTTETN